MKRAVSTLLALAIAATSIPAHADPKQREPWYAGERGKKRVLHLSITVGAGLVFLGSEIFKKTIAPDNFDGCRWCEPPGFDRSVRNALVWDNTRRADILSTIDAYVLAPIVGVSLLYASDHSAGLPRFIDDTVTVFETVALTQLLVQTLKFSVARRRPFAQFGTDVVFEPDSNLSFPSGHSALGFSITVAAGMVCHWRGYWTEPYVWASGIALSVSTEYLRMAADKHYLSDVLVGGGLGIAGGLLIPRLMREDVPIRPVPTGNGVAFVGTF
jgi:membrane-associated phospholipid phosphatase